MAHTRHLRFFYMGNKNMKGCELCVSFLIFNDQTKGPTNYVFMCKSSNKLPHQSYDSVMRYVNIREGDILEWFRGYMAVI